METIQEGILKKFQANKGRLMIGKQEIKGRNSVEKLPPDEFVPGFHILHDLIRGFYKPAGKPYILSYQATESDKNYGKQIEWIESGKSFRKIHMQPPRGERDNRKISDIRAARYNMENQLPIGILYKVKKGQNIILGLGMIVAEGSDGVFTVEPFEFESQQEEKIKSLEMAINEVDTNVIREVVFRRGQSEFKKRLLNRSQECALCRIKDTKLLIASHIKPWKDSSHLERMDVNNGLLLCPNHDRLFDYNYITFLKNGKILISPRLSEETRELMKINNSISVIITPESEEYFKWHRENFFKINNDNYLLEGDLSE